MEKNTVVVDFSARTRVQVRISAIQEEYRSNARLLAYFAQTNPEDQELDNLALLETALLRRQDMLLQQMAGIQSTSIDDLRAKLELWAEEADGDCETQSTVRIVYSVLDDIRRLSA